MLRQVFHNIRYRRRILDRRAGFARFDSSSTRNREQLSEHADNNMFKDSSNTYGLKGIAMVGGGCVALISLSVYLGTYKLSHQIHTLFNQMDSRFDEIDSRFDELANKMDSGFHEIKSILLDQKVWQMEQVAKQNKTIDEQNKEINKQGKTINQHYDNILPHLMASTLLAQNQKPE